jgi:hypothetical protein
MKKTITIKAKVYKPKKRSYPAKALKQGTKVEKEHTPNKKLASTIAKNHLDESPGYYGMLKKVEKKLKKGKK